MVRSKKANKAGRPARIVAPKTFGYYLLPLYKLYKRIYWIYYKELLSFMGSNFPAFSLGIIAVLCGLVTIIPYQSDSTYEEIRRFLFHLFYILMLGSSLFLSMSAFVNEKKQGTMELLYTLPIRDYELVLGKFAFAKLQVFIIALFMSIGYIGFIANAPYYVVISGFLGLLLTGYYAMSVGLFASSLTDSHLLSLLIGALIIGFIDIGAFLAGHLPSPAKEFFSYFHGIDHFLTFTSGAISLRAVIFFLSLTGFFLFLTVRVLESRRWRA